MYSKTKEPLTKCSWRLVKISTLFYILLFNLITLPFIQGAEIIDKTIVLVYSEPILMSELQTLRARLSKESMVDDLLLLDEPITRFKSSPEKQLQYLIDEKILDVEVKRNNLTVTMDKVEQEIRDIAKRNRVTREALVRSLKDQGIDFAEYQLFMKHRIERQALIEQEVTSKIRVNDDDVLAFYAAENSKPSITVFEYSLSQIFISPQSTNNPNPQDRASRILQRLKAGESFEKLSVTESDEPFRGPNATLGTFRSGEFSPEMEKAVRNLNIGDTSSLVKSHSGYHILKLTGKKVITDPEFEKVKERWRSLLMEKRFKIQFKAWLESKREDASIQRN